MIAAAFLLLLTLGVIVLPLLPALREWRRPTDVTPLPIDEADALEPDYLARRFAQRIDAALAQGVDELGGTALSMLPRSATWPSGLLTRKEQRTGRSERIWYGKGDAVLPEVSSLRGPLSCLNEARYGIVWGAAGAARAPSRRRRRPPPR